MDILNKKSFKVFILFFIFFALFTPYIADAQQLNVNWPRIPVPGGSLDINKAVEANRVTIGTVAVLVYVLAIWVAGIIAFISLIYAGLLYIVSGANPGARSKANNQLSAVAWGVGIVLFSFWMLFMINPDIINLRITGLQPLADDSPEFSPGWLLEGGTASCSGKYSCKWENDECVLDEGRTTCELGCTAEGQCEAVNELGEDAQEACELLVDLSCYTATADEGDDSFLNMGRIVCTESGFTDTVWYSEDAVCAWNSGIVQEEAEEFCEWCEGEEGGICSEHEEDPDTRQCGFEEDSVTIADNSSSCFWQATTQTSGSCIEVENCDGGYESNVVCSAFNDDKDMCDSVKNVSCIEEEDDGDDPVLAGTFRCAAGRSSCYYEETLDNCNEEEGYIADPEACSDMDFSLSENCGDTEHTCVKALP